jgi:hypothetical protein
MVRMRHSSERMRALTQPAARVCARVSECTRVSECARVVARAICWPHMPYPCRLCSLCVCSRARVCRLGGPEVYESVPALYLCTARKRCVFGPPPTMRVSAHEPPKLPRYALDVGLGRPRVRQRGVASVVFIPAIGATSPTM